MADVMFIHLQPGGVCELRFVWRALQKARKFFSVNLRVAPDLRWGTFIPEPCQI